MEGEVPAVGRKCKKKEEVRKMIELQNEIKIKGRKAMLLRSCRGKGTSRREKKKEMIRIKKEREEKR